PVGRNARERTRVTVIDVEQRAEAEPEIEIAVEPSVRAVTVAPPLARSDFVLDVRGRSAAVRRFGGGVRRREHQRRACGGERSGHRQRHHHGHEGRACYEPAAACTVSRSSAGKISRTRSSFSSRKRPSKNDTSPRGRIEWSGNTTESGSSRSS